MRVLTALKESESAPGVILMVAALAALIVANSSLGEGYHSLLEFHAAGLSIEEWINDGLMALFFLTVGLEVKREFAVGQLNSWSLRVLPGLAAAGGVIVPALIYVAFNARSAEGLHGWAIPTATDIAFALGVLALAGPRVPLSLKVLLTAIAVIDDLIAVVIIAFFYTAHIEMLYLGLAGLVTLVLILLNALGVVKLTPYLLLGVVLWWLVLKSGVHATLAGVVLALTIPLQGKKVSQQESPLEKLEHGLGPWVGFLVIPVFGFANAGVSLAGLDGAMLTQPVVLGVAVALFVGKQLGIFVTIRACALFGIAPRPEGANWLQVYALAVLCGIGFTMSLFVNLLAFEHPELQEHARLGVFIGSLLSGLLGWGLLRFFSRASATDS
ncbi:Na+/H+ antiporter NhaA [Carnimonas nigrificans]|uniref:Na+/H+ antiporter NhaA n=1 Tax=Carnimonas nigrificans TaxID=64323 RepID=UPI0004ADE081|nr:Na+/H+ antiporter NhaA [Carnimonas nigrificans]